jgi:hypothetical protein
MRSVFSATFVVTVLMASHSLRADGNVVSEVNHGEAATPKFSFKEIPAPSNSDAGSEARFAIVAGQRDKNGGDLDCLNDGRAPDAQDDPKDNFFFAAGTTGGRLLVDLGQPRDVKAVVTYSWHPGGRGPQVYTLYAASARKDFNAQAASKKEKLDEADWKRVASVDTHPQEGNAGGQYGVMISLDPAEPHELPRYLLFEVSRTERGQPFDNTFFSEIDVLDGQEHKPAAKAAPVVEVLKIGEQYEISFDLTEAPELKPWVNEKLKPACAEWYPKIVGMLPSDGFEAPRGFRIEFQKDGRGVAYTAGDRVVCAVPWFKNNLDGEAAGAVVHELVHVVQQYRGRRGGNRNPGWLVEGLADYIRWFLYEPKELRPRPNPDRAKYTDSYRTTAAFLNYVVEQHDKDCIRKFNAAMREGRYNEALWKEYTGKPLDEVWDEYVRTLRER